MDVSAANQNTPISLQQGEYRLYTSRQVARPSFLTGIDNQPVYDDSSEALFDVFPNPFTEEAVIMFTGEYEFQPHTVEVFSADGSRVWLKAVPAGINKLPIEGAGLAPGVYYLKVSSGRISSVKKVVRLQR
jgi:hypothetical protein